MPPRARPRAGGRGPADSYDDRSLYDRCITRGVPGSMMPAIYGNSYQIVQGPDAVAITYEMVHETRVIPLDGRPHVERDDPPIPGRCARPLGRQHAGRRDDELHRQAPYRGSSEHLKIVERFTPLGPDTLEWSVTFDDPHTWARPWTFAMNLTNDESQPAVRVRVPRRQLRAANILTRRAPKSGEPQRQRRTSAASTAATKKQGTSMNELQSRAASPASILSGLAAVCVTRARLDCARRRSLRGK